MKQDVELLKYLAKHDKQIERIYNQLIKELAKIGASISDIDSDSLFSFDDYPQVSVKVDKLLNQYAKILKDLIVNGMKEAVNMSYSANALILQEFSAYSDKAIAEQRETAKNAFISSRTKPKEGLSLSQKVWNYTRQTKAEFEAAMSEVVEDGLMKGISAEELGRKVRNKLNHPEMVYRRYHLKKLTSTGKKDVIEWRRKMVDHEGNVRYIKEDLEKVGQGVYRSSRKNAFRLAATEINMAYRYADCIRWESEPFVLGIRIRLSENHTCNGKPFMDMCDELAGDYPKWFMWKGWHPRCRCSASPILCSKEEMLRISKLSENEYKSYKPKELITDVPDNFKKWVADNQDRIDKAAKRGTLPYIIQDNQRYIKRLLRNKDTAKYIWSEKSPNASEVPITSTAEKGFKIYKQYSNGGRVEIHELAEKGKSDYKDLLTISREFAKSGKVVKITPRVHFKNEIYEQVYGKLNGTVYERKCPDLKIDGKFYEYESYLPHFKKEKISSMISHGVKQSPCIIINNNKGCSDRFILNNIQSRLHDKSFKSDIKEVWVYEKGLIRLIYKNSGRE